MKSNRSVTCSYQFFKYWFIINISQAFYFILLLLYAHLQTYDTRKANICSHRKRQNNLFPIEIRRKKIHTMFLILFSLCTHLYCLHILLLMYETSMSIKSQTCYFGRELLTLHRFCQHLNVILNVSSLNNNCLSNDFAIK